MRALRGVTVVTGAVVAVLLAQVAPSQAADGPRLTCFGKPATIVGTPGPDILVGGPDDVVVGLGGDDSIMGVTVCGGAGDDGIGSPAIETLVETNDKLDGGKGDDVLYGFWGVDVLLGGPGNDYIDDCDGEEDDPDGGDPGTDVMRGGPGNDSIHSVAGRNLVYGDEGDDRIHDYTHVRTVISGGPGNDTIDARDDNNGLNPFQPDKVAGDAGRDSATVNRIDKVFSTESVTYVD
jgi:Ca2+-binding RTX toxin-like protein